MKTCDAENLEANKVYCDTSFADMITNGDGWFFQDQNAAIAAGSLRSSFCCTYCNTKDNVDPIKPISEEKEEKTKETCDLAGIVNFFTKKGKKKNRWKCDGSRCKEETIKVDSSFPFTIMFTKGDRSVTFECVGKENAKKGK